LSAVQLVVRLRSLGVRLHAEGDKLKYKAPPGVLDDGTLAEIKAAKPEIMEILRQADSVQHTIHYVPVRDGTKLSAEVFRPKRDGSVVREALPAVWCHERYNRSTLADGETRLDTQPWLRRLLAAGYVVVAVDARGSGASTGQRVTEFSREEVLDSHDVTEWLAAQPFCDGNVGMFGDSYLGIAQLLAAAAAPPHLKAIFPGVAMHDLYSFLYPGGVFRDDFAGRWGDMVRSLKEDNSTGIFVQSGRLRFRDSVDPQTGEAPYVAQSPSSAAEAITASGVPVCLLSGWYDLWVRDAFAWFTNLGNPRRLIVGPWCHNDRAGLDLAAEHLRWFDTWLKGIDTGVMDEPPIRYYTIGAQPGEQWRTATVWPLPHARPHTLHLHPGGVLDEPAAEAGADAYRVDYTTTTGRQTRWANGYMTYAFGRDRFRYDLRDNDSKAMVYTSAPLPADLEVTGHPIMHLFASSTHDDGDFFVYLEEVDPEGTSHYVTEGVLRASHRALGPPPYDFMGLPFHPGTQESLLPWDGEPVELVIDLHPTSWIFKAGHQIRLAITGCDRDNALTPRHDPAPVVHLHRGGVHPSRLVLPVEESPS